jgi:hypothetical protein
MRAERNSTYHYLSNLTTIAADRVPGLFGHSSKSSQNYHRLQYFDCCVLLGLLVTVVHIAKSPPSGSSIF